MTRLGRNKVEPANPAPGTTVSPRKKLSPAAERALAEAAARRAAQNASPAPPKEVQGRGGLDPVRYGDWEVKGIASDF
jgi:hypothetical protein